VEANFVADDDFLFCIVSASLCEPEECVTCNSSISLRARP